MLFLLLHVSGQPYKIYWILIFGFSMCDLKTELDKYASHILFLFHKDSRILRSSSYPDKGITQQPYQYRTRQEITLPQLKSH